MPLEALTRTNSNIAGQQEVGQEAGQRRPSSVFFEATFKQLVASQLAVASDADNLPLVCDERARVPHAHMADEQWAGEARSHAQHAHYEGVCVSPTRSRAPQSVYESAHTGGPCTGSPLGDSERARQAYQADGYEALPVGQQQEGASELAGEHSAEAVQSADERMEIDPEKEAEEPQTACCWSDESADLERARSGQEEQYFEQRPFSSCLQLAGQPAEQTGQEDETRMEDDGGRSVGQERDAQGTQMEECKRRPCCDKIGQRDAHLCAGGYERQQQVTLGETGANGAMSMSDSGPVSVEEQECGAIASGQSGHYSSSCSQLVYNNQNSAAQTLLGDLNVRCMEHEQCHSATSYHFNNLHQRAHHTKNGRHEDQLMASVDLGGPPIGYKPSDGPHDAVGAASYRGGRQGDVYEQGRMTLDQCGTMVECADGYYQLHTAHEHEQVHAPHEQVHAAHQHFRAAHDEQHQYDSECTMFAHNGHPAEQYRAHDEQPPYESHTIISYAHHTLGPHSHHMYAAAPPQLQHHPQQLHSHQVHPQHPAHQLEPIVHHPQGQQAVREKTYHLLEANGARNGCEQGRRESAGKLQACVYQQDQYGQTMGPDHWFAGYAGGNEQAALFQQQSSGGLESGVASMEQQEMQQQMQQQTPIVSNHYDPTVEFFGSHMGPALSSAGASLPPSDCWSEGDGNDDYEEGAPEDSVSLYPLRAQARRPPPSVVEHHRAAQPDESDESAGSPSRSPTGRHTSLPGSERRHSPLAGAPLTTSRRQGCSDYARHKLRQFLELRMRARGQPALPVEARPPDAEGGVAVARRPAAAVCRPLEGAKLSGGAQDMQQEAEQHQMRLRNRTVILMGGSSVGARNEQDEEPEAEAEAEDEDGEDEEEEEDDDRSSWSGRSSFRGAVRTRSSCAKRARQQEGAPECQRRAASGRRRSSECWASRASSPASSPTSSARDSARDSPLSQASSPASPSPAGRYPSRRRTRTGQAGCSAGVQTRGEPMGRAGGVVRVGYA